MAEPPPLADLTTLRLGGRARRVVVAESSEALVRAVAEADGAGEPVLLVAGGSNLVVCDAGFEGTVVLVRSRGVWRDGERQPDTGDAAALAPEPAEVCGGVLVRVCAGEDWDRLVTRAVARGWVGIEALAGIPGSVGATPVQNVGAYGQEVAQTIASVRCWDRHERRIHTLAAADCGFGYRDSRFKREPGRWLVLEVTFQLRVGDLGPPVRYAQLARALGVEIGQRAPLADVRAAVLRLRSGKGMVLDVDDHDTWSAGSFFTNPVLDAAVAASLPDGAPRFEQPDGRVKTSAAWLIEHAGFGRGYGDDRVSLSTKHSLALTNRGGARTADLLRLAEEVRRGVAERFGVRLDNEPVLVGCDLPALPDLAGGPVRVPAEGHASAEPDG